MVDEHTDEEYLEEDEESENEKSKEEDETEAEDTEEEASLEDLAGQPAHYEGEFQETFFDNSPTGDFAVPVLEQGETANAPDLERATADAPRSSANAKTENENPYIDYNAQGTYDNEKRGEERFDIRRGLIADTSELNAPVLRPFAFAGGQGGGGEGVRDDLANFRDDQRKYQEASEDDRSQPFARGRRRKERIF